MLSVLTARLVDDAAGLGRNGDGGNGQGGCSRNEWPPVAGRASEIGSGARQSALSLLWSGGGRRFSVFDDRSERAVDGHGAVGGVGRAAWYW